jgi:hypothetical protein
MNEGLPRLHRVKNAFK